jgi:hypothetical protein
MSCHDTDAGYDPEYAGVGITIITCSPPGGPVQTTKEYSFDHCENNLHTEIICQRFPGGERVERRELPCGECSSIREGVCLRPL